MDFWRGWSCFSDISEPFLRFNSCRLALTDIKKPWSNAMEIIYKYAPKTMGPLMKLFNLNMPTPLMEALKREAERKGNSVAAEIRERLARSLEERGQ
jgi:hypothetical protein